MFLAVKALRIEKKLELATKLRSASYARQADAHQTPLCELCTAGRLTPVRFSEPTGQASQEKKCHRFAKRNQYYFVRELT